MNLPPLCESKTGGDNELSLFAADGPFRGIVRARKTTPKILLTHGRKQTRAGNLASSKRGSRRRATLLVESMYKGECEALTRKVIELGLAGDVTCLRIAMDRLLPPLKGRPITFKLPTLHTISDAQNALSAIIAGTA